MIINAQFYTKDRPRVFYVMKDSPGCCQGQQDDFSYSNQSVHFYYITLIKGRY